MNFDPIILTLIIATPLAGAILLAFIPEHEGSKTHAIGALLITLFTLLLTLLVDTSRLTMVHAHRPLRVRSTAEKW